MHRFAFAKGIRRKSIVCFLGMKGESGAGKDVSALPSFLPKAPQALKFEQPFPIGRQELQTFHLRPASGPVSAWVQQEASPASPAEVCASRKAAISTRSYCCRVKAAPPYHCVSRTQCTRIGLVGPHKSDFLRWNTAPDKRLTYRQER